MTRFDDLQILTALMRERQLGQLRDVLAEEETLRREIAGLHGLRHAAFHDTHAAPLRRRLGADHAWNDWLGMRLTELNAQLARVLARKAPAQDAARAALARDTNVEDLRRRDTARSRANRERQSERTLQALYQQSQPDQ